MAAYRWYCGDLRTGRIFTEVPLIGTSHGRVMDDAGPMSGTADLADSGVFALNLASAAAPAKTFLAVAYVDNQGNETFLEGGPVWHHDYDDTTGMLQITAAGLWSYFDHRKVIQVLGALNPATVTATYTGLSLGTIAKRLIELAATHVGGSPPVVLPADAVAAADDAHTRTYPGYELNWVGESLRNLTGVINGPEIAFRPRRNSADGRYLEWVMLTGTEADPLLHQTGADWIWDGSLPQSSVIGVSMSVDGTLMADEAWSRGSGADVGTIIGHSLGSTLTDAGYPLLEIEVTGHESVEVPATVNGYAQTSLTYASRPVAAFTVIVQRDAAPNLAQYAVGDYMQLVVQPGHRYLPAGGTFRCRITAITCDDSERVALQCAAAPGSF